MEDKKNKINNFYDLDAWKEGHRLVLMVYKATENYPKPEMFGLTNQTRRAVVSVTSNIAEGFSRNTFKDKLQFYAISLGSLTELQNQIIIAKDLNYLSQDSFDRIMTQSVIVHKITNGLIKRCRLEINKS